MQEDIIKEFNKFIKKWCGSYYPHLIDSDENDGEEFRQLILSSISQAKEEGRKQGMEAYKKLENIADCYASVIARVYDGEKIEVADKEEREKYNL